MVLVERRGSVKILASATQLSYLKLRGLHRQPVAHASRGLHVNSMCLHAVLLPQISLAVFRLTTL